ncbi:MAG: 50S ribosomal protein L11 methyltransferase [Desulfovibrio sp.]|nr:50S ribosomal protein L11 methyltransferase [Desulfovibrio sp.]
MKKLFCLEVVATGEDVDRVTGFFALNVSFGWEEEVLSSGQTRFRVHCENESFIQELQGDLMRALPLVQCHLESLDSQDWLVAWRQFFTPVKCGRRFVVLPPWLADTKDFPGRTSILIEPKSAFGTGHHATTALCLSVLSDLLDSGRVRPGQLFLDLGTGTGVLAIACAKSGLAGDGYDIDPLALDNARENRDLNKVEGLTLGLGSVDSLENERYDLLLANILAGPLTEMAPRLVAVCKPGACLVLSGLLVTQADGVENAYRALGLPSARRVKDGEWCALVWE